jgi:thiol-disulfide isomerase/thioredoxin
MPCIDLNTALPAELQHHLVARSTIVACLCADWCDVCKGYRPNFEALSAEYPDILFLWIDIEDQASLVDHLDVDNFPTLLIQQNDIVSFYGAMQADTTRLKRQINQLSDKSLQQLQQLADSGDLQRHWQNEANIRKRIANHV